MKNRLRMILFGIFLLAHIERVHGQGRVITRLPTNENVVALTFDACETITPSYFDSSILNFLLKERIPFTVFATGKFADRNREELRKVSALDFVEIENHSFRHDQHMERLGEKETIDEVARTEDMVLSITGKRTKFFRFPGGNYDEKSLKTVEDLNYKVVHWSFESGDPDKKVTREHLVEWVLLKTKPGSILIFHINGRGYSTGKALPEIVNSLKKRGYRFVKLTDYIN
jgi:peptidoglycan/xylan/chitin deacetylase (PgdA/CDA1 family)